MLIFIFAFMNPTNQVLKIYADLRKVKDEMHDYSRQYPDGVFKALFKKQIEKIDWCYLHTSTCSELMRVAMPLADAIRENWTQEYTLERDALKDRIEFLSTQQLKQFDVLLDHIEQGKSFEITIKED